MLNIIAHNPSSLRRRATWDPTKLTACGTPLKATETWSSSCWPAVAVEQDCAGSFTAPVGVPPRDLGTRRRFPCGQEVCVNPHQGMGSRCPGFIPSVVPKKFIKLFSFFGFIINILRGRNSKARVKVSLPDDFCLVSYADIYGATDV